MDIRRNLQASDNLRNADKSGSRVDSNVAADIWRDMRETRQDASLATPTQLSIKDGAAANPKASDLTIRTGVDTKPQDVLPSIELYDSQAPTKKESPESRQIMDTTSKGSADRSQNWNTYESQYVGQSVKDN